MLACDRWRLPLLFLIRERRAFFASPAVDVRIRRWSVIRRLLLPLDLGDVRRCSPADLHGTDLQGAPIHCITRSSIRRPRVRGLPEGRIQLAPPVVRRVCSRLLADWHPVFRALSQHVRPTGGHRNGRRFWTLATAPVRGKLPNLLVSCALGPHWPTTHNLVSDWANFTGTLRTFLWGFIIASNRGFLELITRRRTSS